MSKYRNKKNLPYISVAQKPAAMPMPSQFPTGDIPQAGQTQEITPTHDEIARRAYGIYVELGCPHGQSEQHWKQAERENRKPGRASMSSEC